MPLRLNVGVTKKLGMPEYSSIGASCNLELELEARLLESDLDGFHQQVRSAYIAAQQAVNDELARLQDQSTPPVATPAASANGHGRYAPPEEEPGHRNSPGKRAGGAQARPGGSRGRSSLPATASQVKAIYAIARAQHADLAGLLQDEYGVARPEELSLADASKLIDQIKAASQV